MTKALAVPQHVQIIIFGFICVENFIHIQKVKPADKESMLPRLHKLLSSSTASKAIGLTVIAHTLSAPKRQDMWT